MSRPNTDEDTRISTINRRRFLRRTGGASIATVIAGAALKPSMMASDGSRVRGVLVEGQITNIKSVQLGNGMWKTTCDIQAITHNNNPEGDDPVEGEICFEVKYFDEDGKEVGNRHGNLRAQNNTLIIETEAGGHFSLTKKKKGITPQQGNTNKKVTKVTLTVVYKIPGDPDPCHTAEADTPCPEEE